LHRVKKKKKFFFVYLFEQINEGYPKGAGLGTVNNSKLASGLQNLGDTFLNAFMNCGLRKDGLMVKDNTSEIWIDQLNNEHKIAGIASIGLVELWDIEEGVTRVSSYLESKNEWVRMGAYIATGLFNIGINDENEAAYAIFSDLIYSDKY
jgi:26S proteasome regulatory subunit N1